jgi:hypothetical protein
VGRLVFCTIEIVSAARVDPPGKIGPKDIGDFVQRGSFCARLAGTVTADVTQVVVIVLPKVQLPAGIGQGEEDFDVQALIAQLGPATFVLVGVRQSGMEEAGDGTRGDTFTVTDRESVAAG